MFSGAWHMVSGHQEVGTRSQLWGHKDIANLSPAPLFLFTGGVGRSLAILQTHTHNSKHTGGQIVSSSSKSSKARLQTRKPQSDSSTGHTVRLSASGEPLGHTEKGLQGTPVPSLVAFCSPYRTGQE